MFHIALHFIIPAMLLAIFSLFFSESIFSKRTLFAYAVLIATMVVDLDHLLANPVYDPMRCSIGFHPLHKLYPIIFYLFLSFIPKFRVLRLIGLGLMIHMVLDSIDCQFSNQLWYTPGFF